MFSVVDVTITAVKKRDPQKQKNNSFIAIEFALVFAVFRANVFVCLLVLANKTTGEEMKKNVALIFMYDNHL